MHDRFGPLAAFRGRSRQFEHDTTARYTRLAFFFRNTSSFGCAVKIPNFIKDHVTQGIYTVVCYRAESVKDIFCPGTTRTNWGHKFKDSALSTKRRCAIPPGDLCRLWAEPAEELEEAHLKQLCRSDSTLGSVILVENGEEIAVSV